jgi:hypothetical protein
MSDLIDCPKCGYKRDPDAERCANCGARRPGARGRGQGCLVAAVLVGGLLVALFLVLLIAGAGEHGTSGSGTASNGLPYGEHRVDYQVEGCQADLTYTSAEGATEQQRDAQLPWSQTLTAPSGFFAYISAQNTCDYGTVDCRIRLDGNTVKYAESTGAYVIASCSGRVP